ncbi:thioredoxin domain-containing protein [Vibrio lentus]|nr:thioredoxin domain-containing protein [Vibrio lentus]
MSLALLALCLSLPLAYQKGDSLSPDVIEKLQLNKDELTIVDFFAEWCVSCRELPEVNQLYTELKGTGVTFKGVDALMKMLRLAWRFKSNSDWNSLLLTT